MFVHRHTGQRYLRKHIKRCSVYNHNQPQIFFIIRLRMSNYQQFLYVLVKEVYERKPKKRTDTELRIVFWPEDRSKRVREHFIVYGTRPSTKRSGEFVPYRLVCDTIYEVTGFVTTVFSRDNSVEIELHQFSGLTDDSEDEYNIDWFNTNENESTEIVALDIDPIEDSNGEVHVYSEKTLSRVLNILMQFDTI